MTLQETTAPRLEELRLIDAEPAAYRAAHQAHIKNLAIWLESNAPGCDPSKMNLRASQQRKFDKRTSEIRKLHAATPAPTTLSINEALLRLES